MKTKHLLVSAILLIALGWLANSYVINADKRNITDKEYLIREDIQANSEEAQSARGYTEWIRRLTVNPKTGTVSAKDFDLAKNSYKKNLRTAQSEGTLNFEFMGPDDVGGRTRAFLIDNRDNKTLFAGGVAGGLWKSTTGGLAWIPIARDQIGNMMISSICQDAEGAIYVGTGESFAGSADFSAKISSAGFTGNGIWKSTDGINFQQLEQTAQNSKFKYINELVCSNNGYIYAATNNSLWVSKDKGMSWEKPFVFLDNTTDVKISSSGKVFIVRGAKVYVSNEDGSALVSKSNQFDNALNRIELAIAPSDENIVYALCSYENIAVNANKYFNLYRSEDAGETWTSVLQQHTSQVDLFRNRTQGHYDNIVSVFPDNPNKVILGGIDLWMWTLGGTFEQISLWNAKRNRPYYVHADQHNIVFHPDYANNKTIYFTCDGGIFVSRDAASSFIALNNNYNVTQYYAIDCGPNGEVLGGTQDNGTPYINLLQDVNPKSSVRFTGGDGCFSAVSELDPGALFSTTYNSTLYRSDENGKIDGEIQVNPFDLNTSNNLNPGYDLNPFVTPIDMWESFDYEDNRAYIQYIVDTVIRANSAGLPDTITKFGKDFIFFVPSSVVDKRSFLYEVTAEDIENNGGDSLTIGDTLAIREKYSNLLAIGGYGCIYFTREALDFKNEKPNWDAVVGKLKTDPVTENNTDLSIGTVTSLKWAEDGDALYAISNYGLYRFTGFKDAYNHKGLAYCNRVISDTDTTYQMGVMGDDMVWINKDIFTIDNIEGKLIHGFGFREGTSIATDPNDVNKLIVTCGGYGNHQKVFYTENALDNNPTFTSIDGDLPKVPVYASLISDTAEAGKDLVLLGTEYGVYSTTNIDGTSTSWVKETSMPNVPVFDFAQQLQPNGYIPGVGNTRVKNSGVIYAGTHGLGAWKMNKYARPYTGIEPTEKEGLGNLNLKLYPNPANDYVTVNFASDKYETVKVEVYSLNGTLSYSELVNANRGDNKTRIDVSSMQKGVYVVSISTAKQTKVQKLIVE